MSGHSIESGHPEQPDFHNPEYYKKLLADKRTPIFRRADTGNKTFFEIHIPDDPMGQGDRVQPENGLPELGTLEVVSPEGKVKGKITRHDLSPQQFHEAVIVYLPVLAAHAHEPRPQQ
jgi:hypothetical protein